MVHPQEWRSSKLYKTAVPASQRTQIVSIKKTNQLMLFREINGTYCKNESMQKCTLGDKMQTS